ncbi:hypothetical protein GGD65_004164 [Bradyrhizobium sp. CIR18]|uniref:hypothetical protein n=1 Tax=Bradyrhizobium sp. CIR18 TaxID=2663839 RepID=UPI0017C4140C|nr:hypothetical protein [Bradyrhizobium sp. CIR18]MBB4363131.1 hypothetical protein [Bradyrhizobium sp. CIR18]
MLVEGPGPRPRRPSTATFLVRIRARLGHQVAAVAVARKLTVLCWRLLIKSEDYLWAPPALVANKTRADIRNRGQPAWTRLCLQHQDAARP